MSTLHIVLLLTFILVCFLLISAVLLQTGKGGGMAGLGGGGSDTAFGAHTANVLQKFTGWFVFVFFILVISLSHTLKEGGQTESVMDTFKPVAAPKAAAPATTPTPATTAPATPATPAPASPKTESAPAATTPAVPAATTEAPAVPAPATPKTEATK